MSDLAYLSKCFSAGMYAESVITYVAGCLDEQ